MNGANLLPQEVLKPPVRRGGKAYGYARVSTDEQVLTDSLDSQEQRIRNYWEQHLKELDVEFVHVFKESKSGFKVPFELRPEAAKLVAEVKPGDHIIFTRIDRFGRRSLDVMTQLNKFHSMDVTPHCVAQGAVNGFDVSSKMMVAMGAIIAEWESYEKRIRQLEAANFRRMNGKFRTKKKAGQTSDIHRICGFRQTPAGHNKVTYHCVWAEYWWNAQIALTKGWFDSYCTETHKQLTGKQGARMLGYRRCKTDYATFWDRVCRLIHEKYDMPYPTEGQKDPFPFPSINDVRIAWDGRPWSRGMGQLMAYLWYYPVPPPKELQLQEIPLLTIEWDMEKKKIISQELLQPIGEHVLPMDLWKSMSTTKSGLAIGIDDKIAECLKRATRKIMPGREWEFNSYIPFNVSGK